MIEFAAVIIATAACIGLLAGWCTGWWIDRKATKDSIKEIYDEDQTKEEARKK